MLPKKEAPQLNILLFGGTSEGRDLALWLAGRGHTVTLSVATDYGAALIPAVPGLTVHTGRLGRVAMAELLAAKSFDCVIDATHPYAVEVTEALQVATRQTGTPYHRLLREGPPEGEWLHANDLTQAAALARTRPGSILLTTGAKELEPFAVPGLLERTFPRVLPSRDSLDRCLSLGFPPAHILCMQGPFTSELNIALIRQYDIKIMVTKASGGVGGFREKVAAAGDTSCTLIVVDRPAQTQGLPLEKLKLLF